VSVSVTILVVFDRMEGFLTNAEVASTISIFKCKKCRVKKPINGANNCAIRDWSFWVLYRLSKLCFVKMLQNASSVLRRICATFGKFFTVIENWTRTPFLGDRRFLCKLAGKIPKNNGHIGVILLKCRNWIILNFWKKFKPWNSKIAKLSLLIIQYKLYVLA